MHYPQQIVFKQSITSQIPIKVPVYIPIKPSISSNGIIM